MVLWTLFKFSFTLRISFCRLLYKTAPEKEKVFLKVSSFAKGSFRLDTRISILFNHMKKGNTQLRKHFIMFAIFGSLPCFQEKMAVYLNSSYFPFIYESDAKALNPPVVRSIRKKNWLMSWSCWWKERTLILSTWLFRDGATECNRVQQLQIFSFQH